MDGKKYLEQVEIYFFFNVCLFVFSFIQLCSHDPKAFAVHLRSVRCTSVVLSSKKRRFYWQHVFTGLRIKCNWAVRTAPQQNASQRVAHP